VKIKMALQYHLIATEILVITLMIIALIPCIKRWRDSKNRMYVAVSIYTIAVIIHGGFELMAYILQIDTNIYLVGGLRIGFIIGYLLFLVQFEFMLYLRGLKRFYILPVIITFYLVAGNLLIINAMPFIIYAVLLTYTPAYMLLKDGKRNRNGIAVGMGLFFLFWGLGQTITMPFMFEVFKIIAAITFLLGTKGFYEKYVFPNQEEEQKIIGTWISKFVVKD